VTVFSPGFAATQGTLRLVRTGFSNLGIPPTPFTPPRDLVDGTPFPNLFLPLNLLPGGPSLDTLQSGRSRFVHFPYQVPRVDDFSLPTRRSAVLLSFRTPFSRNALSVKEQLFPLCVSALRSVPISFPRSLVSVTAFFLFASMACTFSDPLFS